MNQHEILSKIHNPDNFIRFLKIYPLPLSNVDIFAANYIGIHLEEYQKALKINDLQNEIDELYLKFKGLKWFQLIDKYFSFHKPENKKSENKGLNNFIVALNNMCNADYYGSLNNIQNLYNNFLIVYRNIEESMFQEFHNNYGRIKVFLEILLAFLENRHELLTVKTHDSKILNAIHSYKTYHYDLFSISDILNTFDPNLKSDYLTWLRKEIEVSKLIDKKPNNYNELIQYITQEQNKDRKMFKPVIANPEMLEGNNEYHKFTQVFISKIIKSIKKMERYFDHNIFIKAFGYNNYESLSKLYRHNNAKKINQDTQDFLKYFIELLSPIEKEWLKKEISKNK